ncbi:sugar phosphate isomerase/epimerase family protein [Methanoregula sp.]|uniref:sugar phosphate isomerase/epimerase family protein n=1 Tax=Methanoregula sp. TaxID=2052170 RepID=UPI002B68FBE2|nr:sugar phosphate isomerase/epimerase family protein [Methanoregula sp.]HVP96119.1 sugar phosphate isomerase/epimerase family protein [Methanoregula sp.]
MLGISTLCLHHEPLPVALDRIAELTGVIEVMDEGRHFLKSAEPLLSHSCTFSIHAPCRGTNLASLLEPIRRASVEVMAECFAVAAEVDAHVVVHPGYFAWPDERREAADQLVRSLGELLAAARNYGVAFSVENMGDWEYFFLKTPAELSLIGDCGFTLDVGHAHQNHCLAGFLERPAQHYHLHDNDSTADAHLAVGKGTIDFLPVMAAVQRSGVPPIIEVADFDDAVTSLRVLGKMS